MEQPRRWRKFRRLLWLLVAVWASVLAGCTLEQYPQSTLHPQSDYATWIQDLLEQLTVWVVVIFVVVQGFLIFAVIRFRSRPGSPEPKHVHGHTGIEIAWTIAPAVILALVAVPTVFTIYKTQGTAPADALQVKVIGHQWWWEFQYPQLGITTASEMHVPANTPVAVAIETADVLHSFWVPAVGGKRDAVPTHTNRIFFTAQRPGVYLGQCAELCGVSHTNMRMKLMVTTPSEFDAWVAAQKRAPAEPEPASLAGRGKQVFTQSACVGCHTIQGVSAGVLGPNLTHVGSRTSIAGSMFDNNAENLGRWLSDPPRHKPGALMPQLGLTTDQVTALVAYLTDLK
jgi:cytochrome c oxidase subunit 2